jgi:hypothetical protein
MMEIHIVGTVCDVAMDQMHILTAALVTLHHVELAKGLAVTFGVMMQTR